MCQQYFLQHVCGPLPSPGPFQTKEHLQIIGINSASKSFNCIWFKMAIYLATTRARTRQFFVFPPFSLPVSPMTIKRKLEEGFCGNHGRKAELGLCTAPEMIPKATPKWCPFLFTSTPKWCLINSWNGMVFRHGIITSLLQRLRSWIAFTFHYSLCDFQRFCHLIAFMSTFASSTSF